MNKRQIVDYTREILSEAFANMSSNAKTDSISDPQVTNIIVSDNSKSLIGIILVLICIIFYHSISPIKTVMFCQFVQEDNNNINRMNTLLCGTQNILHQNGRATKRITYFQANEIKKLIKKLSLKEQKTPNMIHRELKKIYKYARYREMNSEQYYKIRQALLKRLQY